MKFLEKVLILLAVIGLFVRVMMWQGGELLLTVSLPSLAVIYLLMSWNVFKHKEDGHHVLLSFLSGLPFSILFIGILFKLLVWRYGDTLLIIGLLAMVGPKLLGLFLQHKKRGEMKVYFKRLFMRYYIKAGVALVLLLIPTQFIMSVFHRDDPKYVQLFMKHFNEPSNLKYRTDFFIYRGKMFKKKHNIREYQEDSSSVEFDKHNF